MKTVCSRNRGDKSSASPALSTGNSDGVFIAFFSVKYIYSVFVVDLK